MLWLNLKQSRHDKARVQEAQLQAAHGQPLGQASEGQDQRDGPGGPPGRQDGAVGDQRRTGGPYGADWGASDWRVHAKAALEPPPTAAQVPPTSHCHLQGRPGYAPPAKRNHSPLSCAGVQMGLTAMCTGS